MWSVNLHLVEDLQLGIWIYFNFNSTLFSSCFTETQNLMAKQSTEAEKNSLLTVWNLEQDQAHMGDPPADGLMDA